MNINFHYVLTPQMIFTAIVVEALWLTLVVFTVRKVLRRRRERRGS